MFIFSLQVHTKYTVWINEVCMRARKIIFISCIMLLAVMFANGLYVLSYNDHGERNRPEIADDDPSSQLEKVRMESSMSRDMPVNLLVLGLDEEGVRTDVILLMNYDPDQSKLNLLSIARDTKVYARGKYSKINAVYSAGREKMLAEEIRQLTGLRVNYYATMKFKGFRKIVDTLDGVMFDVPFDMDYDDPDQNLHIHLNKGFQKLNGKKAEQLVRYRKGNRHDEGYTDGDIGRIKMQQDFLKALIKQKLNLKYFTKADDIFAIFKEYFRTNIDISDFSYYLPGIRKITAESIASFTLPGESSMEGGVWYFIADKDKTRDIVNNNFFK